MVNNKTKNMSKPTQQSLVGHYFHSMVPNPNGNPKLPIVEWQGLVVARPEPEWYLLQLFSWVMGEELERRIVHISDMKGWRFYESAEEMRNHYEELRHRSTVEA